MTAIFPEFFSYIARLYDKEIIETPWSILLMILLYSCWWGRAVTWTSRTRTGTHPSTRRSDTTPCPSSDSYRTCRTSARYKPPPTIAYHSGSSHQQILLILKKKKNNEENVSVHIIVVQATNTKISFCQKKKKKEKKWFLNENVSLLIPVAKAINAYF